MGVCCSKTAKETGASSSRHYVSVSNSPSLFPTEIGYEQDSSLARGFEETRSRLEKAAETASVVDLNEKSSRSAFIETSVDPTWEAKHRPGERKDDWESLVHKPRWNAEWSEESSTENEDGDNKAIALKPRCSGAMRRLKKKDSKRQPNYKDEIMLTDNIDSIVEKEIPEVSDDAHALAESPGPSSSHAGETKPSTRRSMETEDNKLATHVECSLSDAKPDVRSNETTASSAGAAPGPKKIYAKGRNTKAGDRMLPKKEDVEERDEENSPLAISSVSPSRLEKNRRQNTMDEEDIRVAQEIKNILKEDCLNFSNEPTAPKTGEAQKLTRKGSSRKEKHVKTSEEVVEDAVHAPTTAISSQMLQDSRENSSTELRHLNKYLTREKDLTNGKNPANEVNCGLKDVVPVAESKGEIPAGRVSPPKNAQRPKDNSTMQKEITEEEKLADNIDYILNDDIPAAESSGQNNAGRDSPSSKAHSKNSCTGENNISEEEKLADDIDYILNEDVPAIESNGQNSTGRVSPSKNEQHPKKKSSIGEKQITGDEKLADDIDYILSDDIPGTKSNEQTTAGAVSPKEKAQRAKKKSMSENKLIVDKNIAKDVKDDIPMIEEVKSPISPRKVSPKKKVLFQEPEQADDNLAKDVEDGSNDNVTSRLGALPPPTKDYTRKHSKQADEKLAKDIEYILHEDDIFAVEPEVAIPYSPIEIPRPKTSNPRLSLAMEMDRIFDPESIDCSDQADGTLADDHETVEGASNATMSSTSAAAPRSRKKTRRRKSKYMTIVEDVTEETDSNASVTSTSSASLLQNDSSSSPGTEKHQRTHSTRSKESTEDKVASKDIDHTLKGDLRTGKSLQPISSSSGSLPRRPKTRNPKRMLANTTQSSSSAASSSRTVSRPNQDYLRKPGQAPRKLAKDGFVQGASKRQITSTACKAPRTNNRNNSTKKCKDALIIEDVDSGEQIASSTCTVTRSPKISPREQKHAKDVTAGKKSDDRLQDTKDVASIGTNASSAGAGTRLRKKRFTRPTKETDETNLDDIINEIMEIPTRDSGASVKNHTDVAASLKKKNSTAQPNKAKHTEEYSLDETIEEILGIPDSGASVENHTDVAASLKKKNSAAQHSKTKHTEEIDFDEAIEEILGIPTLGGDSKQAAKSNSMRQERKTNSRRKVTGVSRGMDTKKPTEQTTSVPDIGFPDAKAGSSSVETMTCESGSSVASGDTMRPMAAGSSRVKTMGCYASSNTVKLPSSHITRQEPWKGKQTLPAILIKEENIVRKQRMRASRAETIEPSLGCLQGLATHRNAAVPMIGENSTGPSPGIFYEFQELELMKQIERESRCC